MVNLFNVFINLLVSFNINKKSIVLVEFSCIKSQVNKDLLFDKDIFSIEVIFFFNNSSNLIFNSLNMLNIFDDSILVLSILSDFKASSLYKFIFPSFEKVIIP